MTEIQMNVSIQILQTGHYIYFMKGDIVECVQLLPFEAECLAVSLGISIIDNTGKL